MIEENMSLHVTMQYGMTPLILATKRKSEQLMNILIHAGADVDAQSKDVTSLL